MNAFLGDAVKATKSALDLEQARLQRFKEIGENNQALKLNSNKVSPAVSVWLIAFLVNYCCSQQLCMFLYSVTSLITYYMQ